MSTVFEELVIVGVTLSGSKFRPTDWAERLCGCLSVFGEDQRISYSPYVKPIVAEGIKCAVVNRLLEKINPAAFSFLMSFASDNDLCVRQGRSAPRPEDTASASRPKDTMPDAATLSRQTKSPQP